jgi:hypothetical protein
MRAVSPGAAGPQRDGDVVSTVIVASVIATKAGNGGNARAVLNWLEGFRKLGLRTYYVEQIALDNCTAADGTPTTFDQSFNAAYFDRVMAAAGLSSTSILICDRNGATRGMPMADILTVAEDADLLLNVTGHLTFEPLMRRLRRKAYLDLDPGYTQFWEASGGGGARLGGHDFYFTIGENIGRPDCSVPTCGLNWRPTRQPMVLRTGPVPLSTSGRRFTTVASWRGPYGRAQYRGATFGVKAHEFRKYIELPRRVPNCFEVALDIDPADARDLDALHQNGWCIVDPRQWVPDPDSFLAYIGASDGEWSVAQGVYVDTNSGWFSDRTARYLADGKPAIVQDTGFSRTLPVGEGLIAFRTLDEAVEGVRRVARDPRAHAEASRALAERFFDSDRVLGRLLEDVGVAA